MKNYWILLLLSLCFVACETENYSDNNVIPDLVFTETIDIGLPQYQDLRVPNGWVYIERLGYRGVVVYTINAIDYYAYDAACPHMDCANPMDMSQFPEFFNTCSSDGIFYSIINPAYSITYEKDEDGNQMALPEGQTIYDMQQYVAERPGNGTLLRISNFNY